MNARIGKLYLLDAKGAWKLFDSPTAEDLSSRGITIAATATVGYDTIVCARATVGAWASIGDGATVGEGATVGNDTSIGDGASVGDNARIGPGASVGDAASVGGGLFLDGYDLPLPAGLAARDYRNR